jgi:N-acetylneuraminic acid mutarotase
MNKRRLRIGLSILFSMTAMILTSLVEAQVEDNRIVWTSGIDLPLPRGGYFAAWHNGGLWLAGGSYWKDGKKLWTDEASFYNPKTGVWSKLNPLPKAFGYGATAQIGKDLYLFGGVDGDGNLNKDIYRLRRGNWSKIGESPNGFVYPAYVSIGSKVYIFGGSASAGDVTKATNETLVYDSKTNQWNRLAGIPGAPRQTFSAAAIGKNIYVFGGVTQKTGEKFYNLADAFRFDTRTGKWSTSKKMPVAMRAFWAGSDGKSVYLIGGYAESGLDTVYRYLPSTDSYELVSKLPQPLMDTKFIFNGGKFYGASGEDQLMSRFSGMVIGTLKN